MAVTRITDKRKKASDTEEPDWASMPRYSIIALIEKLQEQYNSGERYVGHLDVMVVLMCLILDGEIDTTSSMGILADFGGIETQWVDGYVVITTLEEEETIN